MIVKPRIIRKEVLPGQWQWVVHNPQAIWKQFGTPAWRLAWDWCAKRNFEEHCDRSYEASKLLLPKG